MKILVTGDKGFVGKETRKFLEEKGHEVIGYDIADGFDILNDLQVEKVIYNEIPDKILHLAAVAKFDEADKDPKRAFEINCLGTKNIADIAEKYGIPIIYASTGSVYMPIKQEPPITEDFDVKGNSVYACTKYVGELYLKKPYIILRYGHLYGKEKIMAGLIGNFIGRISQGLQPVLYGGRQSTDFIYIKDIVNANLLALTACPNKWNQAYNIGSGEEISVKKAGEVICELLNWKGGISVANSRLVDAARFVYDTSKAERLLGFKAKYSFRDGIIDMLKDGGI